MNDELLPELCAIAGAAAAQASRPASAARDHRYRFWRVIILNSLDE